MVCEEILAKSMLARNDENGATLVEMCMTALIFFVLMYSLLDFLLFSYRYATAQFIASTMVRDLAVNLEDLTIFVGSPDVITPQNPGKLHEAQDRVINYGRTLGLRFERENVIFMSRANAAPESPCEIAHSNGTPRTLVIGVPGGSTWIHSLGSMGEIISLCLRRDDGLFFQKIPIEVQSVSFARREREDD